MRLIGLINDARWLPPQHPVQHPHLTLLSQFRSQDRSSRDLEPRLELSFEPQEVLRTSCRRKVVAVYGGGQSPLRVVEVTRPTSAFDKADRKENLSADRCQIHCRVRRAIEAEVQLGNHLFIALAPPLGT